MFLTDVDGGELCFGVLVVLFVMWFGHVATARDARLRRIGLMIGAATFGLSVVPHFTITQPLTSDAGMSVLLRGFILGTLATGLGWCASPVIATAYGVTIEPVQRRWVRWNQDVANRRKAREDAERARVEAKRREEEYARGAPERERRAKEAAAKAAQEADAQLRRQRAREACELALSLHGPDIRQRFRRKDLERFFATYMNESQAPAEVERRAVEVQKLIEAHKNVSVPPPDKLTIAKLSDWYLSERQAVDSLELDDELKQTHFVNLDARYFELSQSILEHAKP